MSSTRRAFLKRAVVMGGVTLGARGVSAWPGIGPGAGGGGRAAVPGRRVGQSSDRTPPTEAEVRSWYTDRRNWGRWGDTDELGAMNLVTNEKRREAARLVQTGHRVSMSRVFEPSQHFVRTNPTRASKGASGSVVDYLGFIYHGQSITHVDALCHMWDADGMWQGRDPAQDITTSGAQFGAITAWSDGIITRGVLIDVPRFRGEPFVRVGEPVEGWELEEAAQAQGVELAPGDALLVYSGREAYQRAGNSYAGGDRPGLGVSCVKFIRDHDVSLLGWDMMDARPDPYGLAWPVHGVLFNYGVALLDNALLEPLADACADAGRYAFMFMALPLRVANGTGSPANPIALF
jgi:kynurenine formamidase